MLKVTKWVPQFIHQNPAGLLLHREEVGDTLLGARCLNQKQFYNNAVSSDLHAVHAAGTRKDLTQVTGKASWRRQIEQVLETVRVCWGWGGQRREFWVGEKPNPSVLVYEHY